MELKGKRVIALGERDGVPGTSIAKCARSAGAEVAAVREVRRGPANPRSAL